MTAEECILEIFPEAYSGTFRSTGEEVMFVDCPGKELHSNVEKATDCAVRYTAGPVRVHCVHTSCAGTRARLTAQVQEAFRKHGIRPGPGKKINRQEQEDYFAADMLAGHIRNLLSEIFHDYRDESFLEKKLDLPASQEKFFSIFPPDSVLWAGKEWESGATWGPGHFRSREDWAYRLAHGDTQPFTTTCIYPAGAVSRAQFVQQLYRVMEFDELSPNPVENQLRSWALFQYLAQHYRLQLALAVHTGNKSPHFWVRDEERLGKVFERFLWKLGADTSCWRPGQPVRLPGVWRTDKHVTHHPQCVIAV